MCNASEVYLWHLWGRDERTRHLICLQRLTTVWANCLTHTEGREIPARDHTWMAVIIPTEARLAPCVWTTVWIHTGRKKMHLASQQLLAGSISFWFRQYNTDPQQRTHRSGLLWHQWLTYSCQDQFHTICDRKCRLEGTVTSAQSNRETKLKGVDN